MEDLSQIEQALVLREEDGTVGLRAGLLLTIYFKNGHSRPVRETVLQALEFWLATVTGQINWAQNPKTGKWRRFQPETVTPLGAWLLEQPPGKAWSLAFHGGEKDIDASAIFFRALAEADWSPQGLDHVSMGLPLTWFAEHPSSFPEFCKKICAILRPISGYGGIGLAPANGDMLSTRFEPAVYQVAQRFPGIEVDDPVIHSLYIGDSIKGVNWLTALGDALVERCGGADTLTAALPPPAKLLPYPGGCIVQSGPKPQIGDSAANREPEQYLAVNRVLKGLRAQDTAAFHHANGGQRFDREASLAWLARFD